MCLALILALNLALAGDVPEVRPTPEGVVSIHISDSLRCSVGCMGDWQGSNCSGLSGGLVTLYDSAGQPARNLGGERLDPLQSPLGGWVDVRGLPPGTYRWTVTYPGRLSEEGQVLVREPYPAPLPKCTTWVEDDGRSVTQCVTFGRAGRELTSAERRGGTWFDVQLRPWVNDPVAGQTTTFTAADLARLPLR